MGQEAIEPFYIGMDLGGTTFKAIAASADGTILGRLQADTQPGRGRDTVVYRMAEAVSKLQADVSQNGRDLAAVGFGIPGILDLPSGVLRRSPNLPGWEEFDVRAALQQHLKVPLAIDNDANAAVLGEAWLGAGRDVSHFIMLTLGTGVGGGVVVGGRILHGAYGYVGEMGHTVVDPNGPPCGCGSFGCLEQFASGTAIARMAHPYYGEVTAREVAEAALRGDVQAMEIYEEVGRSIGIASASLANVLNPQRLVIGGAVAYAFDLLSEPLRTALRERAFVEVYEAVEIVPAQCGTDAGGLGAVYLAMNHGP